MAFNEKETEGYELFLQSWLIATGRPDCSCLGRGRFCMDATTPTSFLTVSLNLRGSVSKEESLRSFREREKEAESACEE